MFTYIVITLASVTVQQTVQQFTQSTTGVKTAKFHQVKQTNFQMIPLDSAVFMNIPSTLACAALCRAKMSYCFSFIYSKTSRNCSLGSWLVPTDQYPASDELLYTTDQYYLKAESDQSFKVKLMNKSNIVNLDENANYTSCMEVRNTTEPRKLVQLTSGQVVMCDTQTDGGGWTIFQRRVSGATEFFRSWNDYKEGFGDYNVGNFYLGNENVYKLSSTDPHELRFDLTYLGKPYYALYSYFKFNNETDGYRLQFSNYSGDAGDAMSIRHTDAMFTTYDKDNNIKGGNCVPSFRGCWWYAFCHSVHLNGNWASKDYGLGLNWYNLTGNLTSAAGTIKTVSFQRVTRPYSMSPLNVVFTRVPSVAACAALCRANNTVCYSFMYSKTARNCTLGSWLVPADSSVSIGDNVLYTFDKYYVKSQADSSFGTPLMSTSNITGLDENANYTSCMEVRNTTEPRKLVQLTSGQVVMCDTQTDGGGWTIFQRRVSGVTEFFRSWNDYKEGFGDYNVGNFYLGNENVYKLSSTGPHELRFDLTYLGKPYYALYSYFKFNNETDGYRLQFSNYSGDAGDAMSRLNVNRKFTTFDRDNDVKSNANCALIYRAGWWYSYCHYAHLNGNWGSTDYSMGLNWYDLTGDYGNIEKCEIKFRPIV
ncbi:uncharacterized protein LOC131938595 [Physella acuta]|uniref:uncharacterized protein LOC131938595 n=1 Tax=Physella acuta TaxID=109671 RepID=UPI0027DAFFFA|nr:uncharacterized protein LOC131938595 [Physella acuta]